MTNITNYATTIDFVERRIVPVFLLECFFVGAASVFAVVGTYWLWASEWRRTSAWPRLILVVPPLTYLSLLVHGVLSFWNTIDLFDGRALFNTEDLGRNNTAISAVLLPVVITETALFGVSTAVFAFACLLFVARQTRPRLPHVAIILVYLCALIHWAANIGIYARRTAPPIASDNFRTYAPIILLSFNTILCDGIILWRMCLIWERRLWSYVAAGFFILSTFSLSIANIVEISRWVREGGTPWPMPGAPLQVLESKDIVVEPTFENNWLGVSTLCSSVASNAFATVAIGLKAWYHRHQLTKDFCAGTRRTRMEQALALLIESGAVYLSIWIAFLVVSIVPAHVVLFDFADVNAPVADAFNAAMVQITAMYPSTVIILVALDRARLTGHEPEVTLQTVTLTPTDVESAQGSTTSASLTSKDESWDVQGRRWLGKRLDWGQQRKILTLLPS
ncbi:unnamed protein product [Peniophora sp. CBMAI 1063]|nr:unnamed protein product [Peniophora sp. CBMAI 1063]